MTNKICIRLVFALAIAALDLGRGSLFAQQPPAPPPGDGTNHPPHADAGPDRKLGMYPGRFVTITLDGTKSYDPDFDVITYVWKNDSTGLIIGSGPTASDQATSFGTYSYTLTVEDVHQAKSSATVTVDVVEDVTPPVVSAPAITVGETEDGGARGSASSPLAAFENGGKTSASDNVDPHPTFLDVKIGGTVVDANTLFPLGSTPVRVRYQDSAGNIGFADSSVNVVDHQDNDVFVPADNPSGGNVLIVRVRGSSSEPFCSPTLYSPLSEGVQIIVDSEGRVVFLAYMGYFVGEPVGLFRCSVPGAAPELLAQFRTGAGVRDGVPEPFPGQRFSAVGGLHLERIRAVTIDHGGTPHVTTEDAYVIELRSSPDVPSVVAVRYRPKADVWEDPTSAFVPQPILPSPRAFNGLPEMLTHGGALYSSDGDTLRRDKLPLTIDVSGTIAGNAFRLDLSLFGASSEIRGGLIIDDLSFPNVESFCPRGQAEGNVMPIARFGAGFSTFTGYGGLVYDEYGGHGLIAQSNGVWFGAAAQTITEDVLDGQDGPKFMNPFTGCSMVKPVVGAIPVLPSFDLDTGTPNGAVPIVGAPNGLYTVVGRVPIQVGTIDNQKVHVTATLPYNGLPGSIAAFPTGVTAPVGTVIMREVDSPVDVVATDPNGKKIGVVGGAPVNDFGDDGFDSGPGEPRFFAIRNPAPGRFGLQSVGTGDGPFTVHVYGIDLDMPFGTQIKMSGTASPGSVGTLDFTRGGDGTLAFVNQPPTANAGADQTVDADANGSATVTLDGSQSSDPDGDALAFSWSGPFGVVTGAQPQVTLPIGMNLVMLTVDDGKGGSSSARVTITVNGSTRRDTTPPVLTLPADLIVEATGPAGAAVTFAVGANDAIDGARPVTCTRASGSMFGVGPTTVTCSAADLSGNVATGTFAVTVRDTAPPALTLPATLTLEATGPSGAPVAFTVSANDVVSGPRSVACEPASGSTFPLGTTVVSCRASDDAGNVAAGMFAITVRDTTAPALMLPANIVAEATSAAGAAVPFTGSANDLADGAVTVSCTPGAGSTIPLGTTTVNCAASDRAGNTSTGHFTVLVRDTTPPVVACTPIALKLDRDDDDDDDDGARGLFRVTGSDAVGPLTLAIGPYDVANGAVIRLSLKRQPGVVEIGRTKKSGIRRFRVSAADAFVVATDGAGNASKAACAIGLPDHDRDDKREHAERR